MAIPIGAIISAASAASESEKQKGNGAQYMSEGGGSDDYLKSQSSGGSSSGGFLNSLVKAGDPMTFGLGLYSIYQTSKDRKKREKKLKERERELSDWFNKEYNKNILDTDYAKAMDTQIKERVKEADKKEASQAAITGATDEARIASKANTQRAIADVQQGIAATGEARKENIRREYLTRQSRYDAQQEAMAQEKRQQWVNFAQNLSPSS